MRQHSKYADLYVLPNGSVALDRSGMVRTPFSLLTNQPNNAVVVPALRQTGPVVMSVAKEGPLLLNKLMAQRSGAATVMLKIQDGTQERQLMNAPCHIDTIFGSGQKAYYLPSQLFLDEGKVVNAFIQDLSGSSNTIRLDAGSQRLRKPMPDPTGKLARNRLLRRQQMAWPSFYTFDTGSVSLGASSAGSGTISFSNEAHFEVHQITVVSTSILFNLNIQNQATGQSFISSPNNKTYEIPAGLVVGTNEFPFRFHEPWFIGAGQKLVVNMTDTSAAPNQVFLTLGGISFRTGEER